MKKLLIGSLVLISVLASGIGYTAQRQHQQQLAAAARTRQQAVDVQARVAKAKAEAAAKAAQPFDKQALSHDDPASIWVVVNKLRPLQPKEFIPNDLVFPKIPLRQASSSEMQLRSPAAIALEQMAAAAAKAGARLMIASGYRSYNLQISVYGSEVKRYGQSAADNESARPGFSEHQSGLAVDLEPVNRQCEIADCFATTTEGIWLGAHAQDYGFIQRYTTDKTAVTGYRAEAWHFRYVGTDLSSALKKEDITTLEEFFGLPAAPDYAP